MKQNIFFLVVLANIFQIACSKNKEPISVEQVPSKYSTILYANKEHYKVVAVKFYLIFSITNNTNEQVNISFPEYIYNGKFLNTLSTGWRTVIPMYFNQKDNLEIIFGNKEVDGLDKLEKTPKEYVFSTAHRVSKDSLVQSMFSSYLEKMKSENKDTLHIGTISELKAKNSPILQLLEGDSIIISFDKKGFYIDPIPVHIK